jgi:hypothetical protein
MCAKRDEAIPIIKEKEANNLPQVRFVGYRVECVEFQGEKNLELSGDEQVGQYQQGTDQ